MLNADAGSGGHPKRKRSWSRAVFSNLQRKGLERRFAVQKYVTKPDRRQLAAMLGLTDAQVCDGIQAVRGVIPFLNLLRQVVDLLRYIIQFLTSCSIFCVTSFHSVSRLEFHVTSFRF